MLYLPASHHCHSYSITTNAKLLSLFMATNNYSLQSLQHPHHPHHHSFRRRRHSIDCLRHSPSLFLKPTNPTPNNNSSSLSSSPFSLSSSSSAVTATAAPTTSAAQPISFDLLEQHLYDKNFRQADEETRRLLIALAGESAQKRGYVFFSEVQFIPKSDLKAIDSLWRKHSDDKFGYSVQKNIWEKSGRDFTRLFLKVGWMKKLDTEIEQYNYRSFPTEFIWELNKETPEGHLPLTNALRGTQLLQNILSHPAFEGSQEQGRGSDGEEGGGERRESTVGGGLNGSAAAAAAGNGSKVPGSKRVSKPDYSF